MKASELRSKTVAELKPQLIGLRQEQFNLRMQRGQGQQTQPHQIKRVRRDVARVKTVISEIERKG